MIIKNYKKLIFTFLTFFIFCFFIFVICESVLRIVSSSKNHNLSFNHNYHEQLGWINPKKTINYIKKMDYQSTVSINSLGLRNKEIGIKKKKRVGIFGDSMTQAIQVNDDKTFTYLLDEMLDKYEVINFGVSGYGTYQNYLMYEIIGKKLDLDIVIVAFAFNDIFDNSLKLQKAEGQSKIEISKRPFIDFSDTVEVKTLPKEVIEKKTIKAKLSETFYFYNFLREVKNLIIEVYWPLLSDKRLKVTMLKRDEMRKAFFERFKEKEYIEAWELTEKILEKFKKSVSKNNSQLHIVSMPIEPIDENNTDMSIFDIKLKEISKNVDLNFLPLEPCFINFKKKNDIDHFHFEYDFHFSEIGHRVAANCLYENLLK